MGETLTLADMATGVYMYRFMTMPLIKRQTQGRVEAWSVRLQQRPAYAETVGVDYRHMFAT